MVFPAAQPLLYPREYYLSGLPGESFPVPVSSCSQVGNYRKILAVEFFLVTFLFVENKPVEFSDIVVKGNFCFFTPGIYPIFGVVRAKTSTAFCSRNNFIQRLITRNILWICDFSQKRNDNLAGCFGGNSGCLAWLFELANISFYDGTGKVNLRYIGKFFLTVFVTILIFSCSHRAVQPEAQEPKLPAFFFYKKALSSIEAGRFETARAELDTAISLRPEFAQFHYTRGRVFEMLQQPDSAIVSYQKALLFKSFFPEVWRRLSELYFQEHRYQRAALLLRKMVADQPDSIRFHLLLAEAYLYNQQPRLALERLNYFEKHGGKSDEVLRVKGLAYFKRHDYSRCIDLLRRYVRIHPENTKVQKILGIACIETGALEEGISHLNIALSKAPDDPEIYLYRAHYFIKRQKNDIARDQLALALQLDSTNVEVLFDKGRFELSQGDTISAESYFNKAIQVKPSCWRCYKFLGIIADQRNNATQALEWFRKYIENIYIRDPEVEQRIEKLEDKLPK